LSLFRIDLRDTENTNALDSDYVLTMHFAFELRELREKSEATFRHGCACSEEMEKDLWRLLEAICHQVFLALQLVLDYFHEPSMYVTNRLVDEFETILPSQAGRIARHPDDLLVFTLYILMLAACVCYVFHELWISFRRFLARSVRCRRKRNTEPLLYRQEVPMGPMAGLAMAPMAAPPGSLAQSPGNRPRPAWLPEDWQMENLEKSSKPRAALRDRQPVCCFDLLGGF